MILYAKCSNDRKEEYRIRTEILERDGKRVVRKVPVGDAAVPYVAMFSRKYEALRALFEETAIRVNRCEMNGADAEFEYLPGETLEHALERELAEPSAFKARVTAYFEELEKAADVTFLESSESKEIFGDCAWLVGKPAFSLADVDMLFHNVLLTEGYTLIDYEWTFFFPLPVRFMEWRCLFHFFREAGERSELLGTSFEQLFAFTDEESDRFRKMEDAFQAYVTQGHVQLGALYPWISPGIRRDLPKAQEEAEAANKALSVKLYFDRGQDYSETDSEQYRTGQDGRIRLRVPADGLSALRVDPTEMPVLLEELYLACDGEAISPAKCGGNGCLLSEERMLFPHEDPQLLISGIPAGTKELTLSMKLVSLGKKAIIDALAEQHNKHYLADLQRQQMLRAAEEEIFARSNALISLSSDKAMRIHKKLPGGTDISALLEQLRPEKTQEACGIFTAVDSVMYRGEKLVIRGWVCDQSGSVPRMLLRDRDGILPTECISFPRPDINDLFSLPPQTRSGFVIKTDLTNARYEHLRLEFENLRGYVARDIKVLTSEAERQAYCELYADPVYAEDNAGYDDWFHDRRVTPEELARQKREVFAYRPKISIIIPLYNTPEAYLRQLMDSVLSQSYDHFEVCLADGSTKEQTEVIVKEYCAADPRVKYRRLSENRGISENTNEAIKMAEGDYLMLVDHDDLLEADACFEIVKALNEDPEIDVCYTDEDKLMFESEVFFSPHFKTDYNPDLLCSINYIAHIFCVRKSLADALAARDGAYERAAFDGAQDYDFILRCVERAKKVHHIPRFLYHWRAHMGSTAGSLNSKAYAYEAGRRAVEEHYRRVGIPASVELAEETQTYRSVYRIQGEPLVSVIIPNKDNADLLTRCVASVCEKSSYRQFEILIVENGSADPRTFECYQELQERYAQVRVIDWTAPFNYSAINNTAAAQAKGEFFLFLNNDTEVIAPRFMEEMLGYCQRKDVGAAGARLHYPDGTLQHCGITIGMGGVAGHLYEGEKEGSYGYFSRIGKTQDVSAVTGACMMVRRDVFEEAGGFDESFPIAYNDVDLCLKIRERGYLIVYCAEAVLCHHESMTRGSDDAAVDARKHARQMEEAKRLKEKWATQFAKGDPFFNPNLDLNTSRYVLAGTMPEEYEKKLLLRRQKEEKG